MRVFFLVFFQVDDNFFSGGNVVGDVPDGGVGCEIAKQQVAGWGRVEKLEVFFAVLRDDELITRFTYTGPVGARPEGVVNDEVDVKIAGDGVGVGDGVAALELFITATSSGRRRQE